MPLMEDSPNEAIKNNVIGTYLTAQMASRYHASKFILISTDKAVNPTNIMGAAKESVRWYSDDRQEKCHGVCSCAFRKMYLAAMEA